MLEDAQRREIPMGVEPGGYHAVFVDRLGAGARYRLRLDGGDALHADPASRYQPDGPFGPSEVIDPHDTAWTDAAWHGITRPHEQVIYEMHVGTFTPEGTWAAAAEQLPYLADLGVTTLEMMPINDFAGRRGWGYDGVNLFAPCRLYGTPADLRELVDRAHALGLAVILDVVYNHFGPAGNSYFAFAPSMVSPRPHAANEWGDTIDFSQRGVRVLFATNARYWIEEFHFDGLRLDATQAIHDDSAVHIVAELARAARIAGGARQLWIVAENEPQDIRLYAEGIDAIWNDDFEHAARVALTGASDGYLHDYRGTPQELISALEQGFLYQGQLYAWQRNTRGTPTRGISPAHFVHCLENHDQVANTGMGDRLITLADPASLRALTAVLLLGPQIPMLFQGQDTGSARPWRYFVDHDPELNALVRYGRAAFLAQFTRLATPEAQAALPDPAAEHTFAACVLDPAERRFDRPWVQLHRDLLRLRRETPCFTDQRVGVLRGAVLGDRTFCLRWWHEAGDRLLLVNLGGTFRQTALAEPLLAPAARHGWGVAWSSEALAYGGYGTPEPFTREMLAIPARAAVLLAPDAGRWLRVEPSGARGEGAQVKP